MKGIDRCTANPVAVKIFKNSLYRGNRTDYDICLLIYFLRLIESDKMSKRRKISKSKISNKIRTRIHREYKQRHESVCRILNGQTANNIAENSMKPTFKENLMHWINKYRVTKRAVNDLLSSLNNFGFESLPKDYRTLLNTQTSYEILEMSGGEYFYIGITKSLTTIFKNLDRNLKISLCFNIDGLPLAKSSKKVFWPILGSIFELPHMKPFVVAIWCGFGKPELNEFLSPFVGEFKVILEDGIRINNSCLKIFLHHFSADAPVRAYIKGKMLK